MTRELTPEQREQLNQLKRIHRKRSTALELLRQPDRNYPALLELVIFRGTSTDAAGAELGVSGEAVAKRLRPFRAKYGIKGRGMAARAKAEAQGVRRPFARLNEDGLMAKVRAEADKATEDRTKLEARADQHLAEMVTIIRALDAGKVPDHVIGAHLGVTTMTVYRWCKRVEDQQTPEPEPASAGA